MEFRVLNRGDIGRFAEIDRTEIVDRVYCVRDGRLVLKEEHWEITWSAEEKQRRAAGCLEQFDRGHSIFGAFDGVRLVGVAKLYPTPLTSGRGRYNLRGMWVSRDYRGTGVGKGLALLVTDEARRLGAETVYVSATPSERTVRFYMSLGFEVTTNVDSSLFGKEPDDIHMELVL